MKKYYIFSLIIFLLTGCICSDSKTKPQADAVIFSYNRPLQLYLLLESIEKYMKGLHEIHIVYRASSPQYETAYTQVFHAFPHVITHAQGTDPVHDFKPLTLSAAFQSPCDYILFAVDDIIVKDSVDIPVCIEALEEHNAYGFFLRLGTHLTDCYPTASKQPLPALTEITPTIVAWYFNQGRLDWAYPNTVDMTLYRKKDIKALLEHLSFHNPNTLEAHWSGHAHHILNKKGLCFKHSKIVNVPLNRVQSTFANRAMQEYSPDDLLAIFNEHKKIDLAPLAGIQNPSAHMEYSPTFITR